MTAANLTDTVSYSSPNVFLQVLNGSGSTITVSISDAGATPSGNAGTIVPVSITAAQTKLIPLPLGAIATTGVATITYSAITSVTAGAISR